MGMVERLRGRRGSHPVVSAAVDAMRAENDAQFATDLTETGTNVAAQVFGLASYASPQGPAPRVSRREAMQVPAMRRAVDLVSVLGTLPLTTIRPDLTTDATSWLTQPEADVPRSVTMARTVVDLALDGVAWWKVTAFAWDGYPARVVRLDPRSVDVLPEGKVHVTLDQHRGTADEWPSDGELIRFEMPGGGWLTEGARAIRTAIMLDAAAARAADGIPPLDWFEAVDGVDPEPEDVQQFLDDWATARRNRSTAYVPSAFAYKTGGFNADQAQMAEARQHAVLEISRVTGIDAEELGVSTTSRTYANAHDRRRTFLDFTLGHYRAAIEDRLSMGDVTKRGHVVRFDFGGFLASDPKSRYEAAKVGIEVGATTREEVREAEGRPPLPASQDTPPAATPEPAAEPQEVPA